MCVISGREKRTKKAQATALRKKSKETNQRAKSRRYSPTATSNRFDSEDKQIFRGQYSIIMH
jgi:hypothetical protein